MARAVVELYAPTTQTHQVTLSCPEGAVRVRGDGLRLEQVVSNLVSNAIKFAPDGGPVEVSVAARGEEAEVAVSDRGVGIRPEDVDDVFLPFRRRAAAVAPGAGLGLSIVRRIVAAHGGRVGRAPGRQVDLPRAPAAPPAARRRAAGGEAAPAGRRPSSSSTTAWPGLDRRQVLAAEGFVWSSRARLGVDRLRLLEGGAPRRGALMDVEMPHLTQGPAVYRTLCDLGMDAVPVVLVSGRGRARRGGPARRDALPSPSPTTRRALTLLRRALDERRAPNPPR
ncbi:MAG: ATP-binding protein [Planctomycetota bacterium]|nr:ATP-binding protein [Planctomycetota bacterium]